MTLNPTMSNMNDLDGGRRKPLLRRSLSTTDVIHPSVVDEEEFYHTCQTGDILLWCAGRKSTHLWAKIIQAGGGSAAVGRRCPVLHSILILRDPPAYVLDYYGYTKENDGSVFVLESSSRYKSGAKLSPLKNGEWMQHQLHLDKEIHGIKEPKLLWRKLATAPDGKELQVPCEFWDWIIDAGTVPYALTNSDFFNLGLVPGAYTQLSSTVANALVDHIRQSWGCMIASNDHALYSVLGVILMLLVRLALNAHFLGSFILFWIPKAIANGLSDGKNPPFLWPSNETKVETLTCSSNTAASLTKAGILSDSVPHIAYLPIDFLPNGVIGKNLMDQNLNKGYEYTKQLQQVVLL